MFHFKQFDVEDNACSMKVGTDGVLLGGWAEPLNSKLINETASLNSKLSTLHFLDIGTGSGLIALMLAQRFPKAHILGIDIDEASARQAAENFAASPWADRLEAKHISIQELATLNYRPQGETTLHSKLSTLHFQLIVSNPPYFRDALKCPEAGRKQARHTDSLSYDELMRCAAQLLAPDGVLALILPAEAESDILTLAAANGLRPLRITRVHTTPTKPAKRILIDFTTLNYRPQGATTLHSKLSTLNFQCNDTTLDALNEPLLRDFYQHDFRNR
ncbi:MAG: methyltransferase [Paludibacteraceae bacterium]|nr:methyltransferase [Paludibacteraceae bacterium]